MQCYIQTFYRHAVLGWYGENYLFCVSTLIPSIFMMVVIEIVFFSIRFCDFYGFYIRFDFEHQHEHVVSLHLFSEYGYLKKHIVNTR